MPAYPLTALVLRKTKLGETDLILTLLAADGRQVRAVAKGARNPRGKLGARVEPFSVLHALLHTGRNLDVLAEAELTASHDLLRSDYDRMTAGAVVLDVLDKVSLEGQGEPQLFEMALVALDTIEIAPVDVLDLVVAAFLLKALAMHGYRPVLDACASCGGSLGERIHFSVEQGGVMCAACGRGGFIVEDDARRLIGALLRSRFSEVVEIEALAPVRAEVLHVVRAYAAHHIPARLRALESYLRQG